ncbi:MAG: ATP-binding cassette domain-containing protein, partial [Verrucomicrobia bacterium]|nr:ATP-binding cassette domain-containing protein [Verrucomicrobiota bacterium]
MLIAENLTKSYGPTVAVSPISFSIQAGRITALLGGNGAGKSTLTRVLNGTTRPDGGRLWFDSQEILFANHSVRRAKELGIRVVHQELSLCTNLNVAENFFLELNALFPAGPWRRKAATLARATLEQIFPGNRIRPSVNVGALSLAQQQMVEIARAAADPSLKLFILDEPTSSLDATRARQLFEYLRDRAKTGLAIVFIGHRLGEILDLAQDFLVLRDGRLVWAGSREETDGEALVRLLSAKPAANDEALSRATPVTMAGAAQEDRVPRLPSRTQEVPLVEIAESWRASASDGPIRLFRGEVVGLAGLEGSGQEPLLLALYAASERPRMGIRRNARAAYVTGDRQKEGVFPLWPTMQNMTVARQARRAACALLSGRREQEWAEPWRDRFRFTESALERPILELSGGNQQKALMSRALVDNADVILLNDPTRGVDVGVKREFYQVLREAVAAGKLVVWYSSEDAEFLQCSRVVVLRRGKITAEISGQDAHRETLVSAIFAAENRPAASATRSRPDGGRWTAPGWLIPLVALMAVLAGIGALNPRALSPFGLGLLLSTAVPLVLISLGQMFVVGRSEIDLGIGAFAGLVNVISATLLVDKPEVGVAALAAGLAAYAVLGWLIHVRRIPALVATLGSAFVWTGTGYALQPLPGGSSPEWLSRVFQSSLPLVPLPLWILVLASVAAGLLNASRLGIVQRGFGNNAVAMRHLGWPALRSHVITYLLSAGFGLAAGLCLTGVNTASDINAASPYTL